MPTHAGQPGHDLDLLRVDDQLSSDEVLVRDTVRAFTAERVDAAHRGLVRGRARCPANSPPNSASWACSACT